MTERLQAHTGQSGQGKRVQEKPARRHSEELQARDQTVEARIQRVELTEGQEKGDERQPHK